jgi:hypothetical protein
LSLSLVGAASRGSYAKVLLQYSSCLDSSIDPIAQIDKLPKIELIAFLTTHSVRCSDNYLSLEELRTLVVTHVSLGGCSRSRRANEGPSRARGPLFGGRTTRDLLLQKLLRMRWRRMTRNLKIFD